LTHSTSLRIPRTPPDAQRQFLTDNRRKVSILRNAARADSVTNTAFRAISRRGGRFGTRSAYHLARVHCCTAAHRIRRRRGFGAREDWDHL